MDVKTSMPPLRMILLVLLSLLGLCMVAGAELESALAAAMADLDGYQRDLLLTNVTLAALALPPLCAGYLLLRARRRRRL